MRNRPYWAIVRQKYVKKTQNSFTYSVRILDLTRISVNSEMTPYL